MHNWGPDRRWLWQGESDQGERKHEMRRTQVFQDLADSGRQFGVYPRVMGSHTGCFKVDKWPDLIHIPKRSLLILFRESVEGQGAEGGLGKGNCSNLVKQGGDLDESYSGNEKEEADVRYILEVVLIQLIDY